MAELGPAPTSDFRVLPEWVDINGHMNMAYYSLVFDRTVDVLLEAIGLGPDHAAAAASGTFVVETHNRYLSELREGQSIQASAYVVDWDLRRLHLMIELTHGDSGLLAATSEQLCQHVSLEARRSVEFWWERRRD